MKVKEIIVETDASKDLAIQVIDMLRKDCGPYLNEVQGIENALWHHPLYRGVGRFKWGDGFGLGNFIKNEVVNQDREPRDTAWTLHNLADEWFEDNTGIRFRSASIFCTGFDLTAARYAGKAGETVIVFPKGNFDYCWSPNYHDMTAAIDNYTVEEEMNEKQLVDSALMDGHYTYNRELLRAIESSHEIMIHCIEAYLVNIKISYALYGPDYKNL